MGISSTESQDNASLGYLPGYLPPSTLSCNRFLSVNALRNNFAKVHPSYVQPSNEIRPPRDRITSTPHLRDPYPQNNNICPEESLQNTCLSTPQQVKGAMLSSAISYSHRITPHKGYPKPMGFADISYKTRFIKRKIQDWISSGPISKDATSVAACHNN